MPYKNRQRAADYYKIYYKKNKEKFKIRYREYYLKNKVGFLLQLRKANYKRRIEILEYLGGKCKSCGFTDWRALQVDHINGGGRSELSKSGYPKYLSKIINNKNKYQLLCSNCNWIKKYENNETRQSVLK